MSSRVRRAKLAQEDDLIHSEDEKSFNYECFRRSLSRLRPLYQGIYIPSYRAIFLARDASTRVCRYCRCF